MAGHPSRPHLPARGTGFKVSEVVMCIVELLQRASAVCSLTGAAGPEFCGWKTEPSAQNWGQN